VAETIVVTNKRRANPFYVLLVAAGIAFTITACGYSVTAVRQLHAADYLAPTPPVDDSSYRDESMMSGAGFVRFMDDHGERLMIIELAILGIATCAALGTDRCWTRG
jgi:hypothetical protein